MMMKHCLSNAKAIVIFILMALFLCFEMGLQVSPGVMTHELTDALKLNAFGLGLMSGVYFVTYTVMQIPSGLLYDRANFRKIVTIAITICAIGAGLFGLAQVMFEGALARLFMGFGSAFAFLSVLTVAARYFDKKYFAMLTGIAQLLAALGAIGGEIPVAWAVKHIGWRDTMLGLAGFGIVLMLVIWWFLQNACMGRKVEAQTESVKTSLKTISKNKQTWLIALYVFCNWAPVTAFASLWGVPFLKQAYQLSTPAAASLISIIWLGIGLASPVIGALSDYWGRRKPILVLMGLIGLISVLVIVYIPTLPMWLLGVMLFTAGMGSAGQIVTFAVIRDYTAPQRTSTAIGFNNMAMVASGIIVQPLVGRLLNWISGNATDFTVSEFQHALIVLPIAFLICVVIALFGIRETLIPKKF